jgi:hypothetical protein
MNMFFGTCGADGASGPLLDGKCVREKKICSGEMKKLLVTYARFHQQKQFFQLARRHQYHC